MNFVFNDKVRNLNEAKLQSLYSVQAPPPPSQDTGFMVPPAEEINPLSMDMQSHRLLGNHQSSDYHQGIPVSNSYPHLNMLEGGGANNSASPRQTPHDSPQSSRKYYENGWKNSESLVYQYSGPPANPMKVPKQGLPSYFMTTELRSEILASQSQCLLTLETPVAEIPETVDGGHLQISNLYPLEPFSQTPRVLSHFSMCYRATLSSGHSAGPVCIRHIVGHRPSLSKYLMFVDTWKQQQHVNMVQLRDYFVTKSFGGDLSSVFVYDYQPGFETCLDHHFSSNPATFANYLAMLKSGVQQHQLPNLLPECLLWYYASQISSVLRKLHNSNLACRVVHPSKILVDRRGKLKINGAGMFDILEADRVVQTQNVMRHQQQDMVDFGHVLVSLACSSIQPIKNDSILAAMELVSQNYSPEFKSLLMFLIWHPKDGQRRSINDILPLIGARFYLQLETAQLQNEFLLDELSKEVQNGRLFRLLTKLNSINERPEFRMDPSWSETGDRYLVKLFRNFVFHQIADSGQPLLDLSHVVLTLNKLDTASHEKIGMVSPDGQNVIIASYSDIKTCVENCFGELKEGGKHS